MMLNAHEMNYCPRCGGGLIDQETHGRIRRVCPACGFIHFSDPPVAVVTLVIEGGRALMVLRNVDPQSGKWAFPAGFMERGEDPREAAIRKVKEETGIDVKITGLINVMGPDAASKAKGAIIILFEGEVIGGTLQAQDDADEARFFALDDVPPEDQLASFSSLRVLMERWRSGY
jgi:ADP-ribose pyrophosphatase YjhB (NUDIX family)